MPTFPHPDIVLEGCCFPQCHAPVTDKIDMPLCSNHCLAVYKATTRLLDPANVAAYLSTEAKRGPRPVVPERAVGFVYFVRLGDRVKIGHSGHPRYRLKQIPHEEVLAVTIGSASDEKAAHRRFAHLRTTGEWFKAEPELLEYASKLPRHSEEDAA